MFEQALVENGLSEKEAKVYLTVLEYGELTVSQIATKSQIKRTTVYHIVEELKRKGIVSCNTKKSIQYISALSPKILIERFQKSTHLAEQILPDLLQLSYSSPLKPRIQFFDGFDGIKQILNQFAASKEDPLVFTDYEKMPEKLLKFIRKEIVPKRAKKKTYTRLIVPDNKRNREIQLKDVKKHTEHKLMKFPLANNPIEILLFDDSKVGFLSFNQDEMFGIIIDSKAIHQTLKNLFLMLWENSK